MKTIVLAIGLLAVAAFTSTAVRAQETGAVYVVTYFELQPTGKRDAATLLKGLRDATRQDNGNLRAELLESAARPGQYVMLTAWKDQKALDAHVAAAHTKE